MPPAPPPRPLGPRWALQATTRAGVPLGPLLGAQDVDLRLRLNGPAELGFTLNGEDPKAALLEELITDVRAYRDGVLVFRGRVGPTADSIDANAHAVQVTALDYRWILTHRTIKPGFSALSTGYANAEQTTIAWDLIRDTQALTAGSLGITNGATASGVLRDRPVGYYEDGKNLEEALAELGAVSNGFDWEIGPDLVFRTWYPRRGTARDFLIDLRRGGGNVQAADRSVDPADYANVWRQSGADGVASNTVTVTDLASRPEGRWERQEGDTDLKSAASVTARAEGRLDTYALLEPSWGFTLKRSARWAPDRLWLGDTCPIRVQRGRLDVTRTSRVLELGLRPDAGGEVVEVVMDRPPLSAKARRALRGQVDRLEKLERT